MDGFIGKDEAFVKDWLVCQGVEKLVDVFKVCFLNFRYSFITCKHINISDKVNYIDTQMNNILLLYIFITYDCNFFYLSYS